MKRMNGFPAMVMIMSLVLPLMSANSAQAATISFNDPGFSATWNRVDKPVDELAGVGRGYTWGPVVPAATGVKTEIYNGNARTVQYFDKARMEVNNPQANPNDLFYVTTGLLVKELVTGNRQDGDSSFTQLQPSTIQIAGDPNSGGGNPVAPTYASFKGVITANGNENGVDQSTGSTILAQMSQDGTVFATTPPEERQYTGYDEVTRHNIADVFVNFSNRSGTVWNGSSFGQDQVFFNNPVYVLGRPVTEAYWVRSVVGGTEKWVLVQLFERRVLTYTQGNPAGFEVEMGNVGQHYYQWRYQQPASTTPTPTTPPTTTPVPAVDQNVTPASGGFGTTFVVKNGGYTAGQKVSLWTTDPYNTVNNSGYILADKNGKIEVHIETGTYNNLTVPPGSNYSIPVDAVDSDGNAYRYQRIVLRDPVAGNWSLAAQSDTSQGSNFKFTIIPATATTVTPASGKMGTTFIAQASGFLPGETVYVWTVDPKSRTVSLGSIPADSNGTVLLQVESADPQGLTNKAQTNVSTLVVTAGPGGNIITRYMRIILYKPATGNWMLKTLGSKSVTAINLSFTLTN